MKTIQMTINESLLLQVDEVVKAEKINRSAFIREALEAALQKYKIAQLEKQHREGYARIPQKPEEAEIWLTEQVWDDETW